MAAFPGTWSVSPSPTHSESHVHMSRFLLAGALLAHRLSKRQLEIGFGLFLLIVSARFVATLL